MARFLDFISLFSSFLPVLAGLIVFHKIKSGLLSFFIFFCFVLFSDIIITLTGLLRFNNMPLFNFYFLFEAIFLFYLFYQMISNKTFRNTIIALNVIYLIVWFLDNCVYHNLYIFNPGEKIFKFIIFILLCVWMMNIIAREINLPLPENFRFWFILGFMIYFSSCLIVIATSTWVFKSQNKMAMLYTWSVHSIITVIVNCILTYGILCFSRRKSLFS
jgi:hypothetical protein